MLTRFGCALPVALCFSLAACGSSNTASNSGAGADASVDVASQKADISFDDEGDYVAKIVSDPTLAKQMGTSTGKIVAFNKYAFYNTDRSAWEKGGNLSIINDDSLGPQTRVVCELSPSDGDHFLKNSNRRTVSIKGVNKSFDSSEGLTLSPCIVTAE